MAAEAEAQRATLERFIDGWRSSSAADMVATWSADCTQRTLPFSLGHAARNSTEVMATLPVLQKVVTEYKVSVQISMQIPVKINSNADTNAPSAYHS